MKVFKGKDDKFDILLTLKEINQVFNCSILLNDYKLYVVENQEVQVFDHADNHLDEIKRIKDAYHEGKTIVAKGLENWNEKVRGFIQWLNMPGIDVHLYASPKNGTSYDWHTDDRHVVVRMLFGKKKFFIKEDGKSKEYHLSKGECLFIPRGTQHKAITDGPSYHLSFGIANLLVNELSYDFDLELQEC